MSTLYQKTKSVFECAQLQGEINANALIIPSCLGITANSTSLILEFAIALSVDEETELDSLISNHTPVSENIDVATLPISDLDDKKLAVHASTRPLGDKKVYPVWISAGDDLSDPDNETGGGDILCFDNKTGTASVTKKVYFNPVHGKTWVHEAYLKFNGGSAGDYIDAEVVASSTLLQQTSDLDLVVDGAGYVIYDGAGTGTHGFTDVDEIGLLPVSFSKDGSWDYDSVNGLVPNFSNSGSYNININEKIIHKFYNKVSCRGDCFDYFTLSSSEASLMHPNTFLRITTNNVSDTDWNADMIIDIYRERTYPS